MAIPPIKKTLSLPINDAVNPPSKDPKGAAMLVKLAIKEKTLPINSSGKWAYYFFMINLNVQE